MTVACGQKYKWVFTELDKLLVYKAKFRKPKKLFFGNRNGFWWRDFLVNGFW